MKKAKATLKVEVEFECEDYENPSEAAEEAFLRGATHNETVVEVDNIFITGEIEPDIEDDDPMSAVRHD